MNVYLRELKSNLKSFLLWSGGIMFLLLSGMGKYDAGSKMDSGSSGMNEMMQKMPQSMQSLFGVGVFDMGVIIDFYAVMYLYLALIAAAFAVSLGSGIISKEERDRTSEFLMVKPITRALVLLQKLLAALTYCVAFSLITFFLSLLTFSIYAKELYVSDVGRLCGALLCIQICFVSIGFIFASSTGKHKRSTAMGVGVMLVMLIISFVVDIFEQVDILKYFTFFQYFDAKDLLVLGWPVVFPILAVLLCIVLIASAFFVYKRRDLRLG
jgi:ABC-2 type transport system permease protein